MKTEKYNRTVQHDGAYKKRNVRTSQDSKQYNTREVIVTSDDKYLIKSRNNAEIQNKYGQ